MPEIEYAFLADAAETPPGQKFHVLGGGIARIGGRTFPLRHPHLALVVGLLVTAPETEREHEIRFVLLDPDGGEVAGATGSLTRARLARRPRQHPDVLDRPLERDVPDARRLLVPDPRQRLRAQAAAARHHGPGCLTRPHRRALRDRPDRARPATSCRRSTRRRSLAARHTDRMLEAARASGFTRWVTFLEPLPDRLRDGDLRDTRSAALRVRAAYGPKDSIRDSLAEDVTEPVVGAIDRLLKRDRPPRGALRALTSDESGLAASPRLPRSRGGPPTRAGGSPSGGRRRTARPGRRRGGTCASWTNPSRSYSRRASGLAAYTSSQTRSRRSCSNAKSEQRADRVAAVAL